MRPLRLEVTAFGPYLDTQTVDFEALGEHGLFLIHGPTGSGKSSVLDAMCFALFGETTGGERGGTDFVSTLKRAALDDPEAWPRTGVVFIFEHLGRRYRIARFPTQERAKKRGEGTLTEQTEGSLEDLDEGTVLASKPTDVSAQMQEMLRCTVDQFRQTVMLPQGDFRKVVTDHKERRSILAAIFRTERFADLARRLKDLASGLAREGEAKEKERRELLARHAAENRQALSGLVEDAASAERVAADAKRAAAGARDAAFEAKTEGDHLAAAFDDLEGRRARQKELESQSAEMAERRSVLERGQRAARLTGDREHLDAKRREVATLGEQVEGAQGALSKAERDVAEAERARDELEARRSELDDAEALRQRLRSLKPVVDGLAEKRSQREGLVAQARAAAESVTEAEERVRRDEARVAALGEERKGLRPVAARETEARERVARLDLDRAALARLERLREEIAGVDAEIARLRGAEDPLARLTEAVREHAPSMLAANLPEGDPCPVCGSPHHPQPATGDGGVEGLERAFQSFGQAAAALEVQRERRRSLTETAEGVANERGWTEGAPARNAVEDERRNAQEQLDSAVGARTRIDAIDGEAESLDAALPEARAELQTAREAAEEARSALAAADAAIAAVLEGLAEEHRDPDAFARALAAAEEAHATLQQRFTDAAEGVQRAQKAHEGAAATLRTLEGQATTAREALERLAEAFAEKLAKEGFADRADLDAATLGDEDLNALAERVRTYDEEFASVRASVAENSAKLEGKERPDVAALEDALAVRRQAYEKAETAWTEAQARSAELARNWTRFEEIERSQAELREKAAAAKRLSDTANGQLTGRARVDFETFVLQSIFHQVLTVGNHHLHHMTGGRYSLHLRMDDSASARGLELDVSDHASGGEMREVRTLSGGEGFMASLALALALSEIAQQQSGGAELGALFVDEGFGSLDDRALAQVVEILRGLRQDHRIVGVISHVDALKRSIPVQLLVEPTERGSRIRVSLNA